MHHPINPLIKQHAPDILWFETLRDRAQKLRQQLKKQGTPLPKSLRKFSKDRKFLPQFIYKFLIEYPGGRRLSYLGALKAEAQRLRKNYFEEENVSEMQIIEEAKANLASWGIRSEKKKKKK